MTALMAESAANCTGTETVLEVGAGCGYAAAVLGVLAARVIAMEIDSRAGRAGARESAPHRAATATSR